MTKFTKLAVETLFAPCSFDVAHADAAPAGHFATVQFGDVDTNNTGGIFVLYKRIQAAAQTVCRDLEPGRDVKRSSLYDTCLRTAIEQALVKIDRPALTSYAATRGAHRDQNVISIARNDR